MLFLTLRPSDPISPWEKKRTGSQTLPASPTTPPPLQSPPCHLPLALHLHPKPIPTSTDHDQSLKEETGFAMTLEIPPQTHNYT